MHPFTAQLYRKGYIESPYMIPSFIGSSAIVGTGIADLFVGEDNALNSGEFVQNGLLVHTVPTIGATIGASIGGGGRALRTRMNMPANRRVVDVVPVGAPSNGPRRKPINSPLTDEEIYSIGRDSAAGAAAGLGVSGLATMGYITNDMFRQSEPESLGQALSMKDRAELNELIDQNSSGGVF